MALMQKKPEAAKFMGTQVKPAMAKLLNLDEWTPDQPEGVRLLRLPHPGGRARGRSAGCACRARQASRRRLVAFQKWARAFVRDRRRTPAIAH